MKIVSFALVFLVASMTYAQSSESIRPSVSVVGEAELKVLPDQVVFTLEVITFNKEVTLAKRANDNASAKTLTVTKTFQINPQDVQTDSLTISPKYTSSRDPRGENVLLGYEVKNRLRITLKDLTKIDSFLANAIEAGVNRVASIDIENSQMQKHQERARALAVTNAESKARAYAKQLGLTLGKAYVIREEEADQPGYATGYGSGSGNGSAGDGDSGEYSPDPKLYDRPVTIALGQITIEEKIYVIFELIR
jgi:uncharacterized protein